MESLLEKKEQCARADAVERACGATPLANGPRGALLCCARRRCFNVDGTAAGWTPRGGMCVASTSTTQQCGARLKEDAEDVAGKLT